jgi:hypothetical protein
MAVDGRGDACLSQPITLWNKKLVKIQKKIVHQPKKFASWPVHRRIMASQWMPIDGLTGTTLRSKIRFQRGFRQNMLKAIGYILDAGLDFDEQYGRPGR